MKIINTWCGPAKRALVVSLSMFAVCASAPSVALVTADVGVSALVPNFLDDFTHQESPTGSVSAFLDKQEYFSGATNLYAYHGTGSASASYFALGASSQVTLVDDTPLRYDSTQLLQSVAQFSDDITVPGSGPGFFEMLFHLEGTASSTPTSTIQAGVFFNANINFVGGVTLNSFALGYLPQGQVSTGLIPITLGVPFHITAALETSIQRVGPGTDPGPINVGIFYGNTAALTGLLAYDGGGLQIPSFSIQSDAGVDYSALTSVPLPPLAWLFGTVVAGLFIRLRRPRELLCSRQAGCSIGQPRYHTSTFAKPLF